MLPDLVTVGLLAAAQLYGELCARKRKVFGGGASLWSQCLNPVVNPVVCAYFRHMERKYFKTPTVCLVYDIFISLYRPSEVSITDKNPEVQEGYITYPGGAIG